jgi:hypothetical protein
LREVCDPRVIGLINTDLIIVQATKEIEKGAIILSVPLELSLSSATFLGR